MKKLSFVSLLCLTVGCLSTNGQVVLEADIMSGGSDGSMPKDFTVFNDKLFFSANNGSIGRELWSFNGVSASLEADIDQGFSGSSIRDLIVYNGKLYFIANVRA